MTATQDKDAIKGNELNGCFFERMQEFAHHILQDHSWYQVRRTCVPWTEAHLYNTVDTGGRRNRTGTVHCGARTAGCYASGVCKGWVLGEPNEGCSGAVHCRGDLRKALAPNLHIKGLMRLYSLSNPNDTIGRLRLGTTISAFNALENTTMLGLFNTVTQRMRFNLSFNSPNPIFQNFKVENVSFTFLLGANGTGKSSLMFRFASQNGVNVRKISAHRQTWMNSDALLYYVIRKLPTANAVAQVKKTQQGDYAATWSRAENT